MNLVQIQEHLKGMPIQALMSYANGMNPNVPPYLALGELNRRKQAEQSMQKPEAPQGTVKDRIEGEAGLMALKKQAMDQMRLGALRQQQTAQGQAAQSAMTPQAVPAGAPEPEMQEEVAMAGGGIAEIMVPDNVTQYGSGGIVAFAKGGDKGEKETAIERKRRAREAAGDFLSKRFEEQQAAQPVEPPVRSGADLPNIQMPEQPDILSIPGFQAGTPYSDAMRRAVPAPAAPAVPAVAQQSLADQIPGQSYTAPASTGRMPGEIERNVMNTLAALPGASIMRAAPTGIRALAPYIAALNSSEAAAEIERGRPTMEKDPRLVEPRNVEPEIERGRPTMANDPRLVGIANAIRNASQGSPSSQNVAAPGRTQNVPTNVATQTSTVQPPVKAAPSGTDFMSMLTKQATGEGQQTYQQALDAAAAKNPYLSKQPGEMMEDYLKRMETRRAGEESRQAELEKERTRSALWKSLIAAGEASRGTRGLGALMGGFGRTAGEELEAGRVREEAQIKARREFEDNMAKMRQEIESARIAHAQGRFKDELDHKQKARDSQNKAIEKGAEIQSTEQRDIAKFAQDEKLAQIRFEYEKKLKGIPQAQRATLEEQFVDELVKNGKPRADAIREAKTLGTGADRQDLAELKALQKTYQDQSDPTKNFDKASREDAARRLAVVNSKIEQMAGLGGGGGPKEGDKSTSNSGKPIIYRNGRWEYQ